MAQEKSSLKENIISGIIFLVALGVMGWRYKDCKEREAKQTQEIAQLKAETEQKAKARIDSCLANYPEQSACVKCTCDKCIDEAEECFEDPVCRRLKLGDEDYGDAANLSQVRLKARTECMVSRCRNDCLGK